jgi:hypothetical protein
MKNRYAAALILALASALFASCNGGRSMQSLVPGTSAFGNFSWNVHGVHRSTAFPPCSATSSKVPGKYTVLLALGAFSGSSFTGSGLSLWGTFTVPKGYAQLPRYAPNFGTTYTMYYGTYKLSSFQGCFYLAKVTYKGVSFNGAIAGWPKISNFGTVVQDAEGPLAISIKNISAKGGSGTLTLTDPAGKTVSTGAASIKGSQVIKP